MAGASVKSLFAMQDSAVVNRLNPVSYYYNHQEDKTERFSGFLAQALNAEFPEFVSYNTEGDIYGVDRRTFYHHH